MPTAVVLDTNVWVSALINPRGQPARLIDGWRDGQYQVVVSAALLDEVADVLSRPRICTKYGLSLDEIAGYVRLIALQAIVVTPTGRLKACRDPEDDVILETALLGGAEFLITRDDDIKRDPALVTQMQERGVTVLSVQRFLHRVGETEG